MPETKNKMICPDCGIELNHHAAKIVAAVTAEEAAQVDPELDGIVQEVHCCPGCGKSASRRLGKGA